MEVFGLAVLSAAAVAFGVAQILLDTPLFASASEDGSLEGDLLPYDQDEPNPSENHIAQDEQETA